MHKSRYMEKREKQGWPLKVLSEEAIVKEKI
jgi:hypothetical protein